MGENYSLSLCMVVKNEAENLRALWQSVKHIVDEWVIVDTGSTDNTVEIAQSLGAKVFSKPDDFQTVLTEEHAQFFRRYGCEVKAGDKIFEFGKARTFSFQQATKQFILWLDGDDLLVGSDRLKKIINSNLHPDKQIGIHLLYKYELDQYMNPIIEHYRERVVPNNGTFKWEGRIHEIIVPDVETEYVRVTPEDCHVLHTSQQLRKSHSGARNVKSLLLDLYEQGDDLDPRTLFFLAESMKVAGLLDKSVELYEKYIKLSGWDEERCQAAIRLSMSYVLKNDLSKALDWAYRAIKERPDFPAGYSMLAQVYYNREEYSYAERFAKEAINTNQPDTLTMVDDKFNRFIPLYILAELYMHQGLLKESLSFCKEAMKWEPLNDTLLKIQYTCTQMLKDEQVVKALAKTTEYLKDVGELEKAREMMKYTPGNLEGDPRIIQIKKDIQGEIKMRSQNWVSREKRLQEGKPVPTQYQLFFNDLRKFGCKSVLLVSNEPLLAGGLKQAGLHVKRVIKFDDVTQHYDAVLFDHNLHQIEDRLDFIEQGASFADRLVAITVPNRDPEALVQATPSLVETWLEGEGGRVWNILPLQEGVIYGCFVKGIEKKEKITFFCGSEHTEAWGPLSHVEGGCGGSEEATIYLSRELAGLGHDVEVFNAWPHPCTVDGVKWRNVSSLIPGENFETLIIWRNPQFLDGFPLGKAKRTYLWLHDVPMEYWFKKDRLDRIDKIICLSQYHRSLLPKIKDDKFIISQNGVDIRQFNQQVQRNLKKVIYTSSYDRGLEHLLKIWPQIVSEIPDAELHIYYGWGTFDKLRTEEKHREWKSWMMCQMRDLRGVHEHGRVDQITLAKEFLSAGVFAYPCHFEEISCISAMKAQVGGCIPLTTDYAALAETNLFMSYKIPGNPKKDKGIMERFKQKLINILKQPVDDDIRNTIQNKATKQFSWTNVAKQWSKFSQGENKNA